MRQTREEMHGPPLPTPEEAAAAGRMGHNLRCNKCGGYGAVWIPKARPGWGSLALYFPEAEEYDAMVRRHEDEMRQFTDVKFEQDRR